jgi:hypothetical protein
MLALGYERYGVHGGDAARGIAGELSILAARADQSARWS